MKNWRIIVIVAGCISLLSLCAVIVATWNNIDSEWKNEDAAAQYALNHSPLNRLMSHDVFTGAGDEEVFSGYDVFGRPWYAFVAGTPFQVISVPASNILNEQKAKTIVEEKHHMHVSALHLGYLDNATADLFHTKSVVVWEAYGSAGSKSEYLYLDAYSGAVVWPPAYS